VAAAAAGNRITARDRDAARASFLAAAKPAATIRGA
jgi:hypothetical protein